MITDSQIDILAIYECVIVFSGFMEFFGFSSVSRATISAPGQPSFYLLNWSVSTIYAEISSIPPVTLYEYYWNRVA